MPITALPTPPLRSDPTNFAVRADTFLSALPAFVTQANALEVNVDAKEATVNSNTTLAVNAATSATASATAASLSSGAAVWVSGTTYALGDVRWSPDNRLTYRRIVAGAGTADPSTDAVNWAGMLVPVASGGTGAATPALARTALGAAASGANTDITSITGNAATATTAATANALNPANTYTAGTLNVTTLAVGGASAGSAITMNDSDEGARTIHCNSNQIGFLTQAGSWGAWCDDGGNWTAANNVVAYSDERLKRDWRDLPADFLWKLADVKTGVYDRTDTAATQVGVSAQSLQEVLPEAVVTGADGMLAVAYGNAALTACVLLAREVKSLRADLAALKGGQP